MVLIGQERYLQEIEFRFAIRSGGGNSRSNSPCRGTITVTRMDMGAQRKLLSTKLAMCTYIFDTPFTYGR